MSQRSSLVRRAVDLARQCPMHTLKVLQLRSEPLGRRPKGVPILTEDVLVHLVGHFALFFFVDGQAAAVKEAEHVAGRFALAGVRSGDVVDEAAKESESASSPCRLKGRGSSARVEVASLADDGLDAERRQGLPQQGERMGVMGSEAASRSRESGPVDEAQTFFRAEHDRLDVVLGEDDGGGEDLERAGGTVEDADVGVAADGRGDVREL